jgi:hypothetical protein
VQCEWCGMWRAVWALLAGEGSVVCVVRCGVRRARSVWGDVRAMCAGCVAHSVVLGQVRLLVYGCHGMRRALRGARGAGLWFVVCGGWCVVRVVARAACGLWSVSAWRVPRGANILVCGHW